MEAVIKLSDAVKQILHETDRPTSNFFKYLQLASRAILEIRTHIVTYPKQVTIPMDEKRTISFPDDMVRFISIGAAIDGKLWTYTYRDEIIMEEDLEGGAKHEMDTYEPPYSGAAVRGGKNTHYYKIDYDNRLIYVMGFPVQDVILTYTSTGIDVHDTVYIPQEMVGAIKAYIMWEEIKYNPDVADNYRHRMEYYFHQQRRLLASLKQPTLDQWADALRKSYTRIYKR